MTVGVRVYGVAAMGLGLVCLVWRDLVLGQKLPEGLPGRVGVIWCAGVLLLVAGAAMEWRRSAAWGAAALGFFAVVLMVVVNVPVLPSHYKELGTYFGVAEPLAIAAGALIVYASGVPIERALRGLLMRAGRMTLGACAVFFGAAHFAYMNATAPLVPAWLPPGQVFWGYATGVCFVAAGIALLTGVQARLAAILLTVMLGCFMVLVHVPMLVREHSGVFNWSELAVSGSILGVAWVVADWSSGRSLRRGNLVESDQGHRQNVTG